jgi:H+-translocating NAD(P) transhydrogenase subunit alpha
MKVGIPKEIYPHERRVAAVPETVHKIRKLGYEVVIESGAGDAAAFADGTYAEAGAGLVPNAAALYAAATSSSRCASRSPPRAARTRPISSKRGRRW